MPPSSGSRWLPFSEPNSSRNISGKASEKNAENGLRRNSLFWFRSWRSSSGPVAGWPAVARSAMGHLRVLVDPAGEPQVHVLQRGPRHRQRLQLLAPGQRPAGEQVQRAGRGAGAQQHPVLVPLQPVGQPAGQVGDGDAVGQAEADDRLGDVAAAERLRAALRHDQPAGDDRHLVGQVLRLVHVVGGEQDRLAEVPQALDQLPGAPAGRRVEAGGRLVQEDQVGVADDAEGEVQAALLAAGERLYPRPALVAETDQVDHLADVAGAGVVAAEQADGLLDGQLAVEAGRLQHDADALAEVPLAALRVVAEHLDLAAAALAVALQDLDGGRLAGAVRAEEGEALALGDLEVDAAHGFQLAVALAEAGRPEPEQVRAAALAAVSAFLADTEVDAQQLGDGRWFVRVAGERKLGIGVHLAVGDRTLRVESFFMRAPEERQGQLYPLPLV